MVKKILFVTVFLALSASWCFAAEQAEVFVIFSSNIEQYRQAWEGSKKVFNEQGIILRITDYNLEKENSDLIPLQVAEKKPVLVFAIGPEASMFAKEKIKDIPVVFSMVIHPEVFTGMNITGVSLEIPFRAKLEGIKRILPDVRKIGVIYSSKSVPAYKEILRDSKELGFQLIGKEIDSGKEFPNAFKDISTQIDSFLMIPDTKIYFPKSIEYLLVESLRNKLPVIGLSSTYTRAGALLSFEADYFDLGRHAGELALRIIRGEKPVNIRPSRPDSVHYSLNLLVAERIGLKLQPKAIQEAEEVIR